MNKYAQNICVYSVKLRLNVKKELVLYTHIVSFFLDNDNQYEVNNI